MVPVSWYGRILGVLAVVSFFVVGIELATYSPETVIPREEICIPPAAGGGMLESHLNALVAVTGAGAARLSRLRATIGPDGIPASVDLEFYAGPEGEARFYQLTYRQDTGTCGWTDGLSYPAGSGEMPKPLPADRARALAALGQLRFPDLFDHILVLETGPLQAREGDSPALSERYVGENGTPAGEEAGRLLPFSLIVSEKICTQAGGRNEQCTIVPVERILFVDSG